MESESKEMKILSIKEENELSGKELDTYVNELRKYCENRKLTISSPGAITIAPKLKKIVNVIANVVTNILAGGKFEKVVEGVENIPKGPVIFVSTHQGILDNFVWIPDNPKHALIVHGVETNKLLLYAQYDIGLIFVTKNKDKIKEREAAKLDMMTAILKGNSIIIFPETTWNLSPNKLHLPLNYGFIDVAKKTGVPIIPMVINYTYDDKSEKEVVKKIYIKYGKAIYVARKDNIIEKLQEYSDAISTMRYEIYEENEVYRRKNIKNDEYINFLKGNYKNLELGKKDRKMEREGIQGAANDFYKLFYINDHDFDENGNILESEEIRKIRNIIATKLWVETDD